MERTLEIICFSCHAGSEAPIEAVGQELECPSCGVTFRVPLLAEVEAKAGSKEESGAEAGAAAPSMWYFRMPEGQQYGPITWEALDDYVFEGVLTADCHVLEEGTGQWLWAGEVLATVPEHQSDVDWTCRDQTTLRGGVAAAGLLDRLPCIRERFPDAFQEAHWEAHAHLERECAASSEGFRFLGSRTLAIEQGVCFSEQFAGNFGAILPQRANVLTNSITIGACALGSIDLYVVIPWSNLEMLPHELFAILPGRLPFSLGLGLGTSGNRVWVGSEGDASDPVALMARDNGLEAGDAIVWKWTSRERKGKFTLGWGLQCVPLGSEQFFINMQTARTRGGRLKFGLDAFFGDIGRATRFVMRLDMPGSCEARVPFHSESAELLARMFV